MGIDKDIRDWFANMNTVMANLGAFKMAREAIAVGRQYGYTYKSPSNSKSYSARALLDLYAGNYDTSSAADVEYHSLVVQQNNLIGLYTGLQFSRMLGVGGRSYITQYQTVIVNSSGAFVSVANRRGLNNGTTINLYNTRTTTKVAYPIKINKWWL